MSAAPEISRVPPEMVPAIWQELLPMIERGFRHGNGDSTTPDHLLANILQGKSQLWVVHTGNQVIAGVVVCIQRHVSGKRTVFVELAAGRALDDWVEKIEGLLRDLRDLTGCDSIEARCRAGLARRLKRRGWKRKAEIVELV